MNQTTQNCLHFLALPVFFPFGNWLVWLAHIILWGPSLKRPRVGSSPINPIAHRLVNEHLSTTQHVYLATAGLSREYQDVLDHQEQMMQQSSLSSTRPSYQLLKDLNRCSYLGGVNQITGDYLRVNWISRFRGVYRRILVAVYQWYSSIAAQDLQLRVIIYLQTPRR